VYPSCSAELLRILERSEAPFLLLEKQSQWKKIKANLKAFPHLRLVIIKEPGNVSPGNDTVITWRIFSRAGERLKGCRDTAINVLDAELDRRTKGN
jgi:hypothetical protein